MFIYFSILISLDFNFNTIFQEGFNIYYVVKGIFILNTIDLVFSTKMLYFSQFTLSPYVLQIQTGL